MRTTETATATAAEPRPRKSNRIPASFHIAAAVWLAGMLVFATLLPDAYEAAMQEDRLVEWCSVVLFAVAGVIRLITAIRSRRIFDALVGVFCIFVAGEEFSWGQRLLGFTPPDYFLAHNTQQEFSLHNFADVFGKPKGVLILALAGFGAVLPAIGLMRRGRTMLNAVGATPPALQLMPWFAAAIALLVWYPVDFTGEWVETFAGALFLVPTAGLLVLTVLAALAMTEVSSLTVRANPDMSACAGREVDALLQDIAQADNYGLLDRRVHKRFQSAAEDRYFVTDRARFRSVQCAHEAKDAAVRRRQFAIDPWGMAYWVRSEPDDTGATITVYSFGPNRRRDSKPGDRVGDDVLRVGRVRF